MRRGKPKDGTNTIMFVALKLVNHVIPTDKVPDAAPIKSVDDRKRAAIVYYVGKRTYDTYEAQKRVTGTTYAETKKSCLRTISGLGKYPMEI